MRLRKGCLRRLGFRLSLFALAIQAAIPFLLAAELRAYAADAETAVIEHSLCLHDGTTRSTDHGPHQDCNVGACSLCSTLAASMPCGPPGPHGADFPLIAASAAPALDNDRGFAQALFARPYRSRAPPVA
jgi:hypothetical protein